MVTMPSVISRVVMSYRIHCIETGATMTALSTLYDEHNGNDIEHEFKLRFGLKSEAMLMRKQSPYWRHHGQSASRTFLCVLNVLRIRDNDHEILYQYPFDLRPKHKMQSNLEWTVDDEMM